MCNNVARELAQTFAAWQKCMQSMTTMDQAFDHATQIKSLVDEYLPSGSGINSGVAFNFNKSSVTHLVLNFSYFHTGENGSQDGHTDHTLHVHASLCSDFDIYISGEDKNGIKEYLYDIFNDALSRDLERGE